MAPDTTDTERVVGADRVLAVLKILGEYSDGASLDEITRAMGSAKPTIHRALAALRRAGFADQQPDGRYVLGDEALRIAFTHHEARPEHVRILPVLEGLAARFGETVHYAVLDGREIVYRAKVDPPSGAVRLTSVIGGRNPAHCTAVGKLLLARLLPTLADVRAWIGEEPLVARTSRTLHSATALHRALVDIRRLGYAVDDNENEVGVNCIAVPATLASPGGRASAVSISALAYRTPLSALVAAVEEIRERTEHLGRAA